MDKVIIFGIYHFIGFNLCKKLLDEGIQVIGSRPSDKVLEEYLEEKKYLIGRNANFEEKFINQFKPKKEENIVVVISFYDLFYSDLPNVYAVYEDFFIGIRKLCETLSKVKIICLYPYSFINNGPPFIKQLMSIINKQPAQSIYLPTIFGPWQSKNFLFQQLLLQDFVKITPKYDERENITDAIFIDDVVNEIIKWMSIEDTSDIMFKSNTSDQWLKGAHYLKIDGNIIPNSKIENIDEDSKINIVHVNESIPVGEGLELQRKQITMII